MRYWWVNQNKTYRHEVPGGYLWSPKRKSNGSTNPFYEFMREVAPGDIVFSFADTKVKAIGIIRSHGYESPRPAEFGEVGAYWNRIGWRVDVGFVELRNPIRPADRMDRLASLLPRRYAPLQSNGRGLESVYLTALPEALSFELADLIGHEAWVLIRGNRIRDDLGVVPQVGALQWEEYQLGQVRNDSQLNETTRQAIVQARRGQGLFKQRVMRIEARCRITGVDQPEHLRASHCKPWRDSNNDERLDGENGLLLTPDADHLFDRGFISFEGNGRLLVSPVVHVPSLIKMGIDPSLVSRVGAFSEGQRDFLEFHRESVFLQARVRR